MKKKISFISGLSGSSMINDTGEYKPKEKKKLRIICPFCNAPYDARMEEDLEASMCGYNTCGSAEGEIKIICSNCKRVVYKKGIDLPL